MKGSHLGPNIEHVQKKFAEYQERSRALDLAIVRRWAEQLGCTAPEAYESRLRQMADELRQHTNARIRAALGGTNEKTEGPPPPTEV